MKTVSPKLVKDFGGVSTYVWQGLVKDCTALPVYPKGLESGFAGVSINGVSVDNTTRVDFCGTVNGTDWHVISDIKDQPIIFTEGSVNYHEFSSALDGFRPVVVEAAANSVFNVYAIFRKCHDK